MGRYSAKSAQHGNNEPMEVRMENRSTSKGAMNSSHVDGCSSLERRGSLTERAWTPEGRDRVVVHAKLAPIYGSVANYRASGGRLAHEARLEQHK